MSTVKVKDYGENTTGARYYITGIVANSDLEKNLMKQLGTNDKSKNGAIKCTLAPYNILGNLGITFEQDMTANSNSNSQAQAQESADSSEDKIWYAKNGGVGLIYVKKGSLKDNQETRTAFKKEFGAVFNKTTMIWEIEPKNGVTHNTVIEWFASKEQSSQQHNQANSSSNNNAACSQDENSLIINVSKDTAAALKIIADALNDGTRKITIAVKN